ncbi:MAG TPA: hypothetical protein VH643_25205 [Gemmataceae bacterium]|jgi:hypothetical protein
MSTKRWVILGVVGALGLVGTAVAIALNLRGSREPKHFDANDFPKTADWLIGEGMALADLRKNQKAADDREARLNKTLRGLTGQRVSWRIEVRKVQQTETSDSKQVRLYPRPISRPCSPDELHEAVQKGDRSGLYPSQCFPYVEVQLGDRSGRGARDYFQTSDLSWIGRVEPGASVRIEGVISGIHFERRPLPVVVCEVHIGLKDVRIDAP